MNPQKVVEQSEFMEVVYKCISTLSERLARAFTLRELEGATTEEICKVLDITATNSWVMLHRARTLMRRCLELKWLNQ